MNHGVHVTDKTRFEILEVKDKSLANIYFDCLSLNVLSLSLNY